MTNSMKEAPATLFFGNSYAVTQAEWNHAGFAILDAVEAIQKKDSEAIVNTFLAFESLNSAVVFTELFRFVENETQGKDIEALLNATCLPLPPNPKAIIDAVSNKNLTALQTAVNSDKAERSLSALLVLLASLKNAHANKR